MTARKTPLRLVATALLASSPLLLAGSPQEAAAAAASQEKSAPAADKKQEPTEVVLKLVEKEVADSKKAKKAKPVSPKEKAMTKEKNKLALQNALAAERSNKELQKLRSQVAKLKLEKELLAEKVAIAELKRKEEKMADAIAFEKKTRKLSRDTEIAKIKAAGLTSKLKSQQAEVGLAVSKIEREMKLFEAKQERANFVDSKPVYLADPLQEDGTLVISDRRIDLNGPIFSDTSDHVGERINFFNNQNEKHPIFIVIDSSPGGSVMSGMQILKAMHGSEAPVYVVVKSFAASMAAGITTLAERSFALPDAIILHHQILSGAYGNLTETREHTKQMEEWWERVASPVAEKMGVSLEEFIEQMYANTVTGDWTEFADNAQKIKWVDTVVSNIRETSLLKSPDAKKASQSAPNATIEAVRMETVIPRLNPKDLLYLYNPDGYYQHAK